MPPAKFSALVYPGGQRLKVISFHLIWARKILPSTVTFPTQNQQMIIASRDKKRCHASVQMSSDFSALKFVTTSMINTGNVTDDCFSSLFPALQPDRLAAVHPRSTKTGKCETVATLGLGNRLLKTCWFVDR